MHRGLWHLLSQVSRRPPREDLSAAGTFDPPLLAACLWPPGAGVRCFGLGSWQLRSLMPEQWTQVARLLRALLLPRRPGAVARQQPWPVSCGVQGCERQARGCVKDPDMTCSLGSLPLFLSSFMSRKLMPTGSAGPRCCAHGARKCNVQGCHRFARGSVAEDDLGPAGRRCPQHMGAQNRPARQHSSTVESTPVECVCRAGGVPSQAAHAPHAAGSPQMPWALAATAATNMAAAVASPAVAGQEWAK